MDGRRSDWPLIKHLSETYSPKLAWQYQRLPYVDLSGLPDPKTMLDPLIASGVNPSAMSVGPLLWEDAVYTLSDRLLDRYWVRACYASIYCEGIRSPWLDRIAFPTGDRDDIVVFEVWMSMGGDDDPVFPFVRPIRILHTPFDVAESGKASSRWMSAEKEVLAPLDQHVWERGGTLMGDKDSMGDHLGQIIRQIAPALLYLNQCPEYMAEVFPLSQFRPKKQKENDPRPWTYQHLSKIILLDPAEAPSGERCEDGGGTHASPRPHQRRGHWATLRAEKFKRNDDGSIKRVFRKPAWVGPREWIMEGNRYRVISAEGTS